MTSDDIPTFAVVGAVNHGKSSVVAALAEDDGVRISAMPGETVANKRFDLRDLLVFYDTPGFQNARKALAEIAAAPLDTDPLRPFRDFIERHRADPEFDAECRLLQPIVEGAGIVYVVDGSAPLRDIHLAEMEILRRTGAPRLAVVNRTGADDRGDAWKGPLDQHFNLVRTFDAHRATHADRLDLVESLASIERGWKDRLRLAAGAMTADRDRRVADAAAVVADLLVGCLLHAESARVEAGADAAARAALVERQKRRFMDAIAAKERAGHERLIALYAHSRVTPGAAATDLFADDLFGEQTWRLFGLDARQLLGASAVAGGIAGAGLDAATLGHTLGLGAALGAATGAGGAFVLGRRRPEIAIRWPTGALPGFARAWLASSALRFSGGDVVVGPYRAENFPWILVDRALCVFATVYARSHARRDAVAIDVGALLPVLAALELTTAHWPDAERARCRAVFKRLRAGDAPDIDALRDAIRTALQRVAAAEAEFESAPSLAWGGAGKGSERSRAKVSDR